MNLFRNDLSFGRNEIDFRGGLKVTVRWTNIDLIDIRQQMEQLKIARSSQPADFNPAMAYCGPFETTTYAMPQCHQMQRESFSSQYQTSTMIYDSYSSCLPHAQSSNPSANSDYSLKVNRSPFTSQSNNRMLAKALIITFKHQLGRFSPIKGWSVKKFTAKV